MLSARDRRDGPPAEGAAAGLQGFAVDKTFLSSLKGILLETELALTFIIFICFTASISAYMAAALLEFFITLAFLFLYATQYYLRFDRLNWPCLVRDPAPAPFWGMPSHSPKVPPRPCPGPPGPHAPAAPPGVLAPSPGRSAFTCIPSLALSQDFLRCVSAIIIFLVVSFAAVTSRDGAAIAAFVFGIILVSVFAYDAFKIYRTEMAPRTTQGLSHEEGGLD
nr:LOW QUALITY PROTEIN: CKLF-like MARVEL transmembrane domain-containing protein 5 [Neomonachus schauinslandi]